MLCLLLITGCETQETVLKDSSLSAKDMKISSKKLSDLLSYDIFKNALKQISKTKNNSSLQNKTSIENEFGFSIVSESVKVIEVDDYTFYTMFIEKESSSIKDVDNFIVKIKDNGEIEAYLSKYKEILLGNKTYENIQKELELIFSNKSIASDENGVHCIYTYSIMCNNNVGPSSQYSHDHTVTDDCTLPQYYYVTVDKICFPNGSGGGYSNSSSEIGGNSPDNSSGPHGGSSGGGFDSNGVVLTPIVQHHYNVTANILELSPAQINYINNPTQQSLLNSINIYLINNGVNTFEDQMNEDIKLFCQEAINQTMNNPGVFNSINPFIIEKQIDDSQLDPCSKGVFQQIKNTTNCDFANVLSKLSAGTIYKTTMKTEHNSIMAGGILTEVTDPANTKRTTQDVKYDYTIYVNPDYTNKTKLYIATLLLHEVTHAYFFALLDDLNAGITNSFYEIPILYNAFDSHSSNFNAALTHEAIANSYVNAIADALKEYQPGLPQQVYDDMAWSGLEGTSIFNTIHPPGSSSRQRILNRKAAEQSGHPVGQGTPQEQTNYGQPCN